jgi:hypothetical protein
MTTYRITYLDKYQQSHTTDVPADDPESAIEALEAGLHEQVVVKKIEILD